MSTYGPNFEFLVPPTGRQRKGRFFNAIAHHDFAFDGPTSKTQLSNHFTEDAVVVSTTTKHERTNQN